MAHKKKANELKIHKTHQSTASVKKEKASNNYDKWHDKVKADHEKNEQLAKERKERTPSEQKEFIKEQVE